MNQDYILNPDDVEPPRTNSASSSQPRYRSGPIPNNHGPSDRMPSVESPARERRFSVDSGAFIETFIRRWYVMFFAGSIMLALGVLIGLTLWKGNYTGTAQLMRNDPSALSELFRPQELTTATLISMIQSPKVLQKTGARMQPVLTGNQVAARLKIDPERSTDITNVTVSGSDRKSAAELANVFCEEAVRYTQEIQQQEATTAAVYVSRQLTDAEKDLVKLRRTMPAAISATVPATRVTDKIQVARDELATLLMRYTEAHPLVREQRVRLAVLTEQAAANATSNQDLVPVTSSANNPTGAAPTASVQEYEIALNELKTLEANHSALITRHRLVELAKASPPGYLRILLPATPQEAVSHRPWLKIGILSVFFCALGLTTAVAEIFAREFFDSGLKTPADVKRVTRLPVLATLGNLHRMSTEAQNTWSFRTWIALQNRMTRSGNRGLICGITSSRHGDGRSTWIRLLAHAASQCGLRVLTITTNPASVQKAPGKTDSSPAPEPSPTADRATQDSTSIMTNVITAPAQVAEKLKNPDAQSLVHIPLPGWAWNLERRKQWHSALDLWRKIDNVVILIELPPASVPEAVLLAENLPHLIWLVDSGANALETRTQVETMRLGRGNLVGAVLNRARAPFLDGRLARWFACWTVFAALTLSSSPSLFAQNDAPPYTNIDTPAATPPPPSAPVAPAIPAPAAPATPVVPTEPVAPTQDVRPASFSVGAANQRAPWQQRLTLGPGDLLNLSLFGAPDMTREEVPIGPDGRISFLEAQNVMAAGLTVDELRQRLTDELGKFRRSAQPIVQPAAYRSKKYFVLGKVVQKGVFPLDRPITIIEAVARARGLETGLADRNLVELADLSHSFLARRGQHQTVDFEKLFLAGDLSQNIPLEPDDYLYFPATDLKEVYVLGEVRLPGANVYSDGSGAIASIAAHGGFSDRAWKGRILVIRGSLTKPETFVINANDVLAAKASDFKLQPKDIVYVSSRPWIRAEELLDTAASAFVEAATVTWTGIHVYSNNQ